MANESDKINISLSDMTEKDKNTLFGLIKKYSDKKNKRWEPEYGRYYFCISGFGNINKYKWYDTETDNNYFDMRNCYSTKEQAKFESERRKVLCELKNFADEHNGSDIDWNKRNQRIYFIEYFYTESKMDISFTTSYRRIGDDVYFTSQKVAESAVEHVGKNRILKYVFGIEVDENEEN